MTFSRTLCITSSHIRHSVLAIAAAAAVFPALRLCAQQQPTPDPYAQRQKWLQEQQEKQKQAQAALEAQVDKPVIKLPAGWKVLSEDLAPSNTPDHGGRTPETDPQLSSVFFTAAPLDPARKLSVSFYRARFNDRTRDNINMESVKFVQAVMMQGFVPVTEKVLQGFTPRGTPTATLEITARNALGDQRIFTDTLVPAVSINIYRLYTSRRVSDPTGAAEIDAIIKSADVLTGGDSPGAGVPLAPQPAAQSGTQPASDQAGQILKDCREVLVIMHGSNSAQTGFICNLGGHTNIVTNTHVIADHPGTKLTYIDGSPLTVSDSATAVGCDLLRLQTITASKPLEIVSDFNSTVKIGDAVMIPTLDGDTKNVKPVEGKVVGIGPNLVEVDAPFEPGSSGSPIIQETTGKVLGVAAYVIERSMSRDAAAGQQVVKNVRRFGYRLDNVKDWQAINWQVFYTEAQQVNAIQDLSMDFIKMLDAGKDFNHAKYTSPAMKRAVDQYNNEFLVGGVATAMSDADARGALNGFVFAVRGAAKSDISVFQSRPAYDFFRREVDDEALFRNELCDLFDRILKNQ